jgi:hypothetical protein
MVEGIDGQVAPSTGNEVQPPEQYTDPEKVLLKAISDVLNTETVKVEVKIGFSGTDRAQSWHDGNTIVLDRRQHAKAFVAAARDRIDHAIYMLAPTIAELYAEIRKDATMSDAEILENQKAVILALWGAVIKASPKPTGRPPAALFVKKKRKVKDYYVKILIPEKMQPHIMVILKKYPVKCESDSKSITVTATELSFSHYQMLQREIKVFVDSFDEVKAYRRE